MAAVASDIRQQIRELGLSMVRLEEWAHVAHAHENFEREGDLLAQREDVQLQRSQLLREYWRPRRRNAREALRQA